MSKTFAFLSILALSILLNACSHDHIPLTEADDGRTITVGVGDAIEVKLGTVGPGEYGMPDVSSPSIQFVSVEVVGSIHSRWADATFSFSGRRTGQGLNHHFANWWFFEPFLRDNGERRALI